MKTIIIILLLIFTEVKLKPDLINMIGSVYTYLALGDSYTIGETVLPADNFPNQTVRLLKSAGFDFNPPEIIAKTGWTTDELQNAIDQYKFLPTYDFVSLLIGVNNQYRSMKTEDYHSGFENLLKQAIQFAVGKNKQVIVFSIPDWSVTPFAAERDRKQIAKEIDEFNKINKFIADQYEVHYADITPGTREAAFNPLLLAVDGLHPSAREYSRWAEKLANIIIKQIP